MTKILLFIILMIPATSLFSKAKCDSVIFQGDMMKSKQRAKFEKVHINNCEKKDNDEIADLIYNKGITLSDGEFSESRKLIYACAVDFNNAVSANYYLCVIFYKDNAVSESFYFSKEGYKRCQAAIEESMKSNAKLSSDSRKSILKLLDFINNW